MDYFTSTIEGMKASGNIGTIESYKRNAPVKYSGTKKRVYKDRNGNVNVITTSTEITALPIDQSSVVKLEEKKRAVRTARQWELKLLCEQLSEAGEHETVSLLLAPRAIEFSLVYGARILDIAYNKLYDSIENNGTIETLPHAYRSALYSIKQYRLHNKASYLDAIEAHESPATKRYKKETMDAVELSIVNNYANRYRYFQPDTLTMENDIGNEYMAEIKRNLSEVRACKLYRMVNTMRSMDAEKRNAFFEERKNYVFLHRVFSTVKYNGRLPIEAGLTLADFAYLVIKYY